MASGDLQGSDLLTFGEAAEYVGVSLLDLRERLRLANVPAVWGWRAGAAVHLIPLEHLRNTFPELATRKRLAGPTLAERGIELLPDSREVLQSKPPVEPEPAAVPKAIVPVESAAPVPVVPDPAEPELEKLYGEIEQATAHNAKLMAELNDAGAGLNKLLDEIQQRELDSKPDAPIDLPAGEPKRNGLDKIAQWNQLEAQQKELEKARRKSQHTSWGLTATFAALLVIVISMKGKDYLMAGSGPDSGVEWPTPDSERDATLNDMGASVDGDSVYFESTPPLTIWDADEQAARSGGGEALLSYEVATGSGDSTPVEPQAPPVMAPAKASMSEPMLAPATTVEDEPELVPLQPESVPKTVPLAEGPAPEATPMEPVVFSDDPACLYGKLTAPGQELRQVLGPCIGPWNKELQSVAGGFRHSGDRFCRHHLIVAKDLGGSVDRAKNVAKYAKEEGLLPPLLRLRVEHGAADLLQKRVGKWVESGFEAGLSGQHSVTQGSSEDRWKIESWVRLQAKPGDQAMLRHFAMEMDLAADKGRDRWASFTWIDGGE